MADISASDVKQRITALSDSSTSLETKKSNVEILLSFSVKNGDFAEIVKENNGFLILMTLFQETNDFELKAKITALFSFLSYSGQRDAASEKLMKDINTMSLVNLFAAKDFRIFMQAFGGLKMLGTPKGDSKTGISFSLSAATVFFENMTNLINPSSKVLSDQQKMEVLGCFTQFASTEVLSQAAADATKDSEAALSKRYSAVYAMFIKTLESCRRGDLSLLDLVVAQIVQLIKDGKLFAAMPMVGQLDDDRLNIINKWLGSTKKFNLLYRSSSDGLATSTFHGKCDNKGPTVTIVTSSDGYIFGGYTPVSWVSSTTSLADNSGQSFLFSLKNPRNQTPTKFELTNKTYAIYCSSTYGPTFGGGNDLTCGYNSQIGSSGTTYTNLGNSYTNSTGLQGTAVFTGQQLFQVKEVEVYQVQ